LSFDITNVSEVDIDLKEANSISLY